MLLLPSTGDCYFLLLLCSSTVFIHRNIGQLIDDQNYCSALNFFDKFQPEISTQLLSKYVFLGGGGCWFRNAWTYQWYGLEININIVYDWIVPLFIVDGNLPVDILVHVAFLWIVRDKIIHSFHFLGEKFNQKTYKSFRISWSYFWNLLLWHRWPRWGSFSSLLNSVSPVPIT